MSLNIDQIILKIGITRTEICELEQKKKIRGNIEAYLPDLPAENFKSKNQIIHVYLDESLDEIKICLDKKLDMLRANYKVYIGHEDFEKLKNFTPATPITSSADMLGCRWESNAHYLYIYVSREEAPREKKKANT